MGKTSRCDTAQFSLLRAADHAVRHNLPSTQEELATWDGDAPNGENSSCLQRRKICLISGMLKDRILKSVMPPSTSSFNASAEAERLTGGFATSGVSRACQFVNNAWFEPVVRLAKRTRLLLLATCTDWEAAQWIRQAGCTLPSFMHMYTTRTPPGVSMISGKAHSASCPDF